MADDSSELENSSVEALISMKEGIGNAFESTPPRRMQSSRLRKPNPRIFGEEDDPAYSPRPRKQAKTTRDKLGILSTPDKKIAQRIGTRLRNLLKLPKAHKWVCYEWFYSNIDYPLFEGENDFCVCLKENFPQLKTKKLTRIQWGKIRRLMGKPRRCSPAFFAEERASLQEKRRKIRLLQQRKASEVSHLKDLPDEIPMPLVIGTTVTARLRKPQDGLFTGQIDALDTVHNTYRVTFDRPGLGTHSIPDTEVLSNDMQDTMPLSSFQARMRPSRTMMTPPRSSVLGLNSPQRLDNDPLLGSSPMRGKVLPTDSGTYGGFPVKFLVLVTRLSKTLGIKKEKINELKEMNAEAEKLNSYENPVTVHFQQRYAAVVLELEKLNKELNDYLIGVQQMSQEIAPEGTSTTLEHRSEAQRKCEEEANEIVRRNNSGQGRKMVKNERMLDLIGKLTSLLIQVKSFAENESHCFEFKSLQDTLADIKCSLDPSNIASFENNVEIHVNHIQSGLTQMGNLHAFASTGFNL